ncbi:MAG TPA: chemotaxis protein CheW [Kofleriaceae bacterium]|jgi:chemotaxis signal transduction protein
MSDFAARAAQLRDAFDRAFAAPVAPATAAQRDVLQIRLAGEPFAIALDQVASLHVDIKVVDVPALSRDLLGVIAVRAHVVPAYDLRGVLGLGRELPPRWLVVARDASAAFAFDGFDGLVRGGTQLSIVDLAAACAAVHKER